MKETLLHSEAFEYYYSLGKDRSLVQVAQKFSKSETSVNKWNKAFSWQERIELRDIENSKKLAEKTDSTIVNEKANYRKIIKAAIATFVEKLKSKEIKVIEVSDLEKLIKLDLLLMGESTEEIHKIIVEIVNANKD
jgi:hypothetical protein